MSKEKKKAATGQRLGGTNIHVPFEIFEFTFTEDKLGLGISKYDGPMPHLRETYGEVISENKSKERSCPVVNNLSGRRFGTLSAAVSPLNMCM